MTPSRTIRVLQTDALLRLNGSIAGIKVLLSKCEGCGKQARLSRDQGLVELSHGLKLTCPFCGVSIEVTTTQIIEIWTEQLRRDVMLSKIGIDPDDLYRR